MNAIKTFENVNVKIISNEKGQPLFELYSVGMALGYVKSNGKIAGVHGVHPENKTLFPFKSRIDKVVENAEIKPIVRDRQSFVTEEQLYDLMLEARTDKCKAFRKWVTNEVLPEINHTGTYSLTSKENYKFIPKTFRGQAVITLDDFVYFAGINRYTVRYYIIQGDLVNRTDYFLIDHADLMAFKKENPRCNRYANALYLITKSGFVKLLKLLGIQVKMPECFALAPAKEIAPLPVVSFKYKTEQVVDVPENPKFLELLSKVKQDITAISLLLEQINKFHKEEDFRHYVYVIHQLGFDIAAETGDIQRFKPNIVEKAM